MATPFIDCEPRNRLLPLEGGFARIFFYWTALILLAIPPLVLTTFAVSDLATMRSVGLLVVLIDTLYLALLFLVRRLGGLKGIEERLSARYAAIKSALRLPHLGLDQLFVISVSGDEAGWWLRRLTNWSEVPFILWKGLCALLLILFAAFGIIAFSGGAWSMVANAIVWLCCLIACAVMLLVVVPLLFLIPRFLRGGRYGFGGESFSDSIVARIRAFRFPGSYLNRCAKTTFAEMLMPPSKRKARLELAVQESLPGAVFLSRHWHHCKFGILTFLRHCKVYDSSETPQRIAGWIRGLSQPEFIEFKGTPPRLSEYAISDEAVLSLWTD